MHGPRRSPRRNSIAVAAPVRDDGRRILAALNVSGPRFRLVPRLAVIEERVLTAAAELSERLDRPPSGPNVLRVEAAEAVT